MGIFSRKKLWQIFLVCITISPFADICFGFCQYACIDMPVDINHIFRLFLLLLAFLLILNNKKYVIAFMAYSVWIITGVLVAHITGVSVSLVTDLGWNLKMLMVLGIVLVISNLYKEEWFDIKDVLHALCRGASIAAFSILPTLFGLGYRTYGAGEWGFKGFFYTNNTISIYLLMIYPLMYIVYKGKDLIATAGMCLVALVLIGTKTTMIGGLFITGVMVVVYLLAHTGLYAVLKDEKNRSKVIGACVAIGIGVFVAALIVLEMLYQKYMNTYWYDSMLEVIVSKRNYQLDLITGALNPQTSIVTLLFGFGYSRIEREFAILKVYHAVEMDAPGMYYNFGVIVTVIVMIALVVTIYRAVRLCFKEVNMFNVTLLVVLLLGFGHSMVAGHVVYEALSQMPFWLVVAYINCMYLKKFDKADRCKKKEISNE
ncbi:MAG: O-antigen ligase family protein [Lachnospira sp.]|nr:O-antigen ligase family protein [Lachnospira sp.]